MPGYKWQGHLFKKFSSNILLSLGIAAAPFLLNPLYADCLSVSNYIKIQEYLYLNAISVLLLSGVISSYNLRQCADADEITRRYFVNRLINLNSKAGLPLVLVGMYFSIKSSAPFLYSSVIINLLLYNYLYIAASTYLSRFEHVKNRMIIMSPILINLFFIIVAPRGAELKYFLIAFTLSLAVVVFSLWLKNRRYIAMTRPPKKYTGHDFWLFLSIFAYVSLTASAEHGIRTSILLADPSRFATISTTLMFAGMLALFGSVVSLTLVPYFLKNSKEYLQDNTWATSLNLNQIAFFILAVILHLSWPHIFDYFVARNIFLHSKLYHGLITVTSVTTGLWIWFNAVIVYERKKKILIGAGVATFLAVLGLALFKVLQLSDNDDLLIYFASIYSIPIFVALIWSKGVRDNVTSSHYLISALSLVAQWAIWG